MARRSRDEHACLWGRVKKTVSWRLSISTEKNKCCARKKRELERERPHHSIPARFPKEAPEKGTDRVPGEKESGLFVLCEGRKIRTEVASLGEEAESDAVSRDGKPRMQRHRQATVVGPVAGHSARPPKLMLCL